MGIGYTPQYIFVTEKTVISNQSSTQLQGTAIPTKSPQMVSDRKLFNVVIHGINKINLVESVWWHITKDRIKQFVPIIYQSQSSQSA